MSAPTSTVVDVNLIIGLVITALKTDRGLALQDLLAGAFEYIDTVEFPPAARVYLLDQLATTESVIFLL